MNKFQYNQLNEKLFYAYCDAIQNKDEEFAKILMIDEKVIDLFEILRRSDDINHKGLFGAIRNFFPQPIIRIDDKLSMVEKARLFAIASHREINQLYDGTSYELHLYETVKIFHRFKHLLSKEHWDTVEAACWLHDVVEDVKKNFSQIKALCNENVAAIACALSTNSHGHNRKARADDDYYARIRSVKFATFVKFCDRIANMENSLRSPNHPTDQLKMYQKEMDHFLKSLSGTNEFGTYAEMVKTLERLGEQ